MQCNDDRCPASALENPTNGPKWKDVSQSRWLSDASIEPHDQGLK